MGWLVERRVAGVETVTGGREANGALDVSGESEGD